MRKPQPPGFGVRGRVPVVASLPARAQTLQVRGWSVLAPMPYRPIVMIVGVFWALAVLILIFRY